MADHNFQKRIWLIYPAAISYSGQTAAAELLMQELVKRGWDCHAIAFPPLNRAIRNPLVRYGKYLGQVLWAWFRSARLIFKRRPQVYFSHGQSLASFARTGLIHLLLRKLNPSMDIFLALHGNVFMTWQANDRPLAIFKKLLLSSDRVTVLGEKQRNRVIELGLPAGQVEVLRNACELETASPAQIDHKYQPLVAESETPLRMLHMSLLIESKGYPAYLESLEQLANMQIPRPIEAVLCGPLSFSAYCKRFTTEASKSEWIESKIDQINKSSKVRVKWIPGAYGEEKHQLFEQAQLFVFPSQFPVEAQPLVLLEAMASGTAIITSEAGEIASTVDGKCAHFIEPPTTDALTEVMKGYLNRPADLKDMGRASVARFTGYFTQEQYADRWESLLNRNHNKN